MMDTAKDDRDYERASEKFKAIGDYLDSRARGIECEQTYKKLRSEKQRKEENARKAESARKRKKITIISIASILVIIIGFVVSTKIIIPGSKYKKAMNYIENGDYEKAYSLLRELGDYKNAESSIADYEYEREMVIYEEAMALYEEGSYNEGLKLLMECGNEELIARYKYNRALCLMEEEKFESAIAVLSDVKNNNDCEILLSECYYKQANNIVEAADKTSSSDEYAYKNIGEYYNAIQYYKMANDYSDVDEKIDETNYKLLKVTYMYVSSSSDYKINTIGSLDIEIKNYILNLKDFDYKDSNELYKEIF